MYSRLTFERFLLPDGFSKDLLGDYMFLSVHYYQGLKAKRFDEFFGSYPGLYQEFVRSPFFLYKRYLEIVGRVLLNSLQEKIYPFILSSFEGKKRPVTSERNLYFVFYSEVIELCIRILTVYNG